VKAATELNGCLRRPDRHVGLVQKVGLQNPRSATVVNGPFGLILQARFGRSFEKTFGVFVGLLRPNLTVVAVSRILGILQTNDLKDL
jgi:hypothetical protein